MRQIIFMDRIRPRLAIVAGAGLVSLPTQSPDYTGLML